MWICSRVKSSIRPSLLRQVFSFIVLFQFLACKHLSPAIAKMCPLPFRCPSPAHSLTRSFFVLPTLGPCCYRSTRHLDYGWFVTRIHTTDAYMFKQRGHLNSHKNDKDVHSHILSVLHDMLIDGQWQAWTTVTTGVTLVS